MHNRLFQTCLSWQSISLTNFNHQFTPLVLICCTLKSSGNIHIQRTHYILFAQCPDVMYAVFSLDIVFSRHLLQGNLQQGVQWEAFCIGLKTTTIVFGRALPRTPLEELTMDIPPIPPRRLWHRGSVRSSDEKAIARKYFTHRTLLLRPLYTSLIDWSSSHSSLNISLRWLKNVYNVISCTLL